LPASPPFAAPRLVLFDLGNTLLYFNGSWLEALPRATRALRASLLAQGIPLGPTFDADFLAALDRYYLERDAECTEHTTESVLIELFQAAGLPIPAPGVFRAALDAFYAVTQAYWQPEPDALPTLQTLAARGYRMGLISNAGDAPDVEALIDKAALRPYLEHIFISANIGRRKPHGLIFKLALDAFGLPPEQAVMVGDTLYADVGGANAAGMRSVWIPRRVDSPENRALLAEFPPTAVIDSLSDLPGLLAGWE
jgi:putative hydrolase of the HAD superfamily